MKLVHKKVAEKQKSLLVYADWNCTTGFGAVAKELVDEWAKDNLGTLHYDSILK